MLTLEMILCCVDSLGEACILGMVLWSTKDELVLIDPWIMNMNDFFPLHILLSGEIFRQ